MAGLLGGCFEKKAFYSGTGVLLISRKLMSSLLSLSPGRCSEVLGKGNKIEDIQNFDASL